MVFHGKNLYTEKSSDSVKYRELYAASIHHYIENLRSKAENKRNEYITPQLLCENREKYRIHYYNMLGNPLNTYTSTLPLPKVSKEFVAEDDLGKIYRVMLEITENFVFYGILFLPKDFDETKKYSYIISQHGGGGTPELCSDFYTDTNYTHMTRRVLEKNNVVFAPQLLLWDTGNFSVEYNRQNSDIALKQLGSSITALEIFCIMRSTDYFAAQKYIDSDRIGMIGLSYGGFYTMFTAAADTRIKSAYSSCFFNDRLVYNWQDWVWFNAAHSFLDAETAALTAPRRLYIEVGRNDALFDYQTAIKEYERLLAFYEASGAAEYLRFHVFDGDHMLDSDDSGLDFFLKGLTSK